MSTILLSFEKAPHVVQIIVLYTFYMSDTKKKEKGKAFWQRIDTLLATRKISQSELARAVGIPTNSISTARSRNTLFDIELSYRIAQTLHVSCDYLATGIQKSEDPVLEEAFEDIRLGKRTRDIALFLPALKDKDADMILTILERLGYELPENAVKKA